MNPFVLERPRDIDAAVRAGAAAEFIAGGTDMVQLMQERVRSPARLVDVTLALGRGVERLADKLHIGAGVTMEQLATDRNAASLLPMISQALLESASVQVRNLATIGGNLLQRTRCGYYRDVGVAACNKRSPGSGCAAIGGENRMLAVLGTSDQCIATSASDLAVAFTALEAEILVRGPEGERRLAIDELYRTPGDAPARETTLRPGDIIVGVEVPLTDAGRQSIYLKVRDRASFEWSLLSAGVGLELEGGRVRMARIAMGGVGTKPWRMRSVEAALLGKTLEQGDVAAAVQHATDGARGYGHNDFKITQMPRVLARAIAMAGEVA